MVTGVGDQSNLLFVGATSVASHDALIAIWKKLGKKQGRDRNRTFAWKSSENLTVSFPAQSLSSI